MADKTAFCFG